MKNNTPITDTDQGEFDKLPETEPKSGKLVGIWFTDQTVWGYHGTLPVVIAIEKIGPTPLPGITTSAQTMIISRCPSCQRTTLGREYGYGKVLRWLILPP